MYIFRSRSIQIRTDQGHYFQVVGRLKPGVDLRQAQARLQASAAEYRAHFPSALRPKDGFTVTTYRDAVVQNVRPIPFVL
jgi:hypothetical protein